MTESDCIESIRKMELRAGDMVILKLAMNIEADRFARIGELMKKEFPHNRVLVLSPGFFIEKRQPVEPVGHEPGPSLVDRVRSIEMTLERMEDYQREQNERQS